MSVRDRSRRSDLALIDSSAQYGFNFECSGIECDCGPGTFNFGSAGCVSTHEYDEVEYFPHVHDPYNDTNCSASPDLCNHNFSNSSGQIVASSESVIQLLGQ